MSAEAPLRRAADELAASDDWDGLRDLLGAEEPETLLASPALSYRYGEALYHTGRLAELRDFAEDFEEAAREASDTEGVMRALNLAFIGDFERGRIPEARRSCESLLQLAQADDNREMLARAANNMGNLTHLTGLFHEALSYYRLALPLYQRMDAVRGIAQVHHNLGISHRDLAELDEAADAYRRAATLARQLGYRPLVVLASLGRAEVEARRGDPAAEPMAERSLASAREIGNPAFEAEALRVLGLARWADGRPEEALEALGEAVDRSREAGHRLVEAEAERDRGRLLLRTGREAGGREALERAREIFEELGARAYAQEVREVLAEDPS